MILLKIWTMLNKLLKIMKRQLQTKKILVHHKIPIMEILGSIILKDILMGRDLELLRGIRWQWARPQIRTNIYRMTILKGLLNVKIIKMVKILTSKFLSSNNKIIWINLWQKFHKMSKQRTDKQLNKAYISSTLFKQFKHYNL